MLEISKFLVRAFDFDLTSSFFLEQFPISVQLHSLEMEVFLMACYFFFSCFTRLKPAKNVVTVTSFYWWNAAFVG